MRLLSRAKSFFGGLLRRQQMDAELDEEIRSHLDLLTAQKLKEGMSLEHARREARIELGGLERIKEEVREARVGAWLDTAFQDLRFGLRMLWKSPGFAAVAVLTLALGIGANTTIFSVIDAVLLRPLPYPDSDRIVSINRLGTGLLSMPLFAFSQQNNPGFEDLAAYDDGSASVNLISGERPKLVVARRVSLNYFRLFGASPTLGRAFTAQEDQPAGPEVAVMSYGLWQDEFGGRPSILGANITLGGASYTIVGVTSPGFLPYPPTDLWIPLEADPNSTNQAHTLGVAGRLPAGVTLSQANSWLTAIGRRYVQTHPLQLGGDDNLHATPLEQEMTGDVRPALLILLGAVGLVLLIACANVANLLLARATGRQKEIAVRAALGASRGRIVRQLLWESFFLASVGGALGLALGAAGVRILLALAPGNLPRAKELASAAMLDPSITGFAALLVLVTAILFGLFPAIQLSRTNLVASLQESGRTGAGLKGKRARSALVEAQIAITVVLLCGATLLIRSFTAMHGQRLGFDPRNLLTVEVSLSGPAYSKSSDMDRLARQIASRIERIPGVESAALASALPLEGEQDMIFDIPGRPHQNGYKFAGDVQWRIVSAHYFQTLRIPLVSGRLLNETESARTVVISESMARKYWPNSDPIGQAIVIGPGLGPAFEEGPTEIVGIAGDVRERLDAGPTSVIYQIPSQIPDAAIALVNDLTPDAIIVRTEPGLSSMSVGQEVQQALQADGRLAATKFRTMEQVSLDSTARQNFNLFLLGLFAAMALLLAMVGVYGVMSYSVEQQTREIGIRGALGACPRDILGHVLLQALRLAVGGLVVGIGASLWLTRLLGRQLFGVKPSDPLTFLSVPLILLLVAIAAAYIPARRAMRVDPMVALRHE
jgi:putative ABC transport system permease protein